MRWDWLKGRPFLLGLLAAGAGLRVFQYVADKSLWFDELLIARNILHRSAAELVFEPLRYSQVAPIGFVAVEKLLSLTLGPSDMALRLFPFVCGLVVLPLFWRLAERLLEGYAVPFAVALFAFGAPFIRYSAELKQYGVDVLVAIAFGLIGLRLRDGDSTGRRCLLAGLAGAVMVWFSQASVFIMAGLGVGLLLSWLVEKDAPTRRAALITVPIWAAASLAAIIVSIRRIPPEMRVFLDDFWRTRGGFAPWPPAPARDALWLWGQVEQLFAGNVVLGYRWPLLYAAVAIAGLAVLWRRNRFGALVLLGPFLATVVAAMAQQYPLRTRLALFLVPALLLAVAEGAEWIRRSAGRLHPVIGGALMAALLVAPVRTIVETPPPYWMTDTKALLAFVQTKRQPGDAVYVFSMSYPAVDRYGAEYGIRRGEYTVGGCWRDDLRAYLRDIDRYRGARRVWFLVSSSPAFHQARQTIERYLAAIGTPREFFAVPSTPPLDPVSAYLYDLDDPRRLEAVSASTFPLEPLADSRPLCSDAVFPDP